jgi:hypothetical protein
MYIITSAQILTAKQQNGETSIKEYLEVISWLLLAIMR